VEFNLIAFNMRNMCRLEAHLYTVAMQLGSDDSVWQQNVTSFHSTKNVFDLP
jgi:hypothetical protein